MPPACSKGLGAAPQSRLCEAQSGRRLPHIPDLDRAERAYTRALELNPDSPDALLGHGRVLLARGSIDAAIDRLLHAAAADINFLEPQIDLGDAYWLAGKVSDAAAAYRTAATRAPSLGTPHLRLADALVALGDVRTAVREMERAADENRMFLTASRDSVASTRSGATTSARSIASNVRQNSRLLGARHGMGLRSPTWTWATTIERWQRPVR